MYLRRVVLDGDPESGGEELVLKTLVWTRGVLGRYQSVSWRALAVGVSGEAAIPRPTTVWNQEK